MLDPQRSATTSALLDGLFDPQNYEVWSEFDRRYRLAVVRIIAAMGVPAEDAGDLAQEVMVAFVRDYQAQKYDPERGRLRSWIYGIARNCVSSYYRKRRNAAPVRGESALDVQPAAPELDAIWDAELRERVLDDAFTALKRQSDFDDKTLQAFELYALKEVAPSVIAEQLGMSVNAVYRAKYRCAKKLRSLSDELAASYHIG